MAKTLNPNREIDEFLSLIDDSNTRYTRLYDHIPSNKELDLRKGLAADAAFRLGALWEIFQHRWHIAAISRSPHKFVARIQGELDQGIKGAAPYILRAYSPESLTVPAKPTATQIEKLVDPDGFNLSFKDTEAWIKRANADLDEVYVQKVKAIQSSPEDSCVLELLKALRNALAHGSAGSVQALNLRARKREAGARVGLVGAVNEPLQRDRNNIEPFSS